MYKLSPLEQRIARLLFPRRCRKNLRPQLQGIRKSLESVKPSLGIRLCYDEQGQPRNEVEYHPKNLVELNKRVNHRVESLPRDTEDPAVNKIGPIFCNDTGQEWDKQHYPVNNSAPKKERPELNDIHNISPFSKTKPRNQ